MFVVGKSTEDRVKPLDTNTPSTFTKQIQIVKTVLTSKIISFGSLYTIRVKQKHSPETYTTFPLNDKFNNMGLLLFTS